MLISMRMAMRAGGKTIIALVIAISETKETLISDKRKSSGATFCFAIRVPNKAVSVLHFVVMIIVVVVMIIVVVAHIRFCQSL